MKTEIILSSWSLKCIQLCKEDFNNKENCIMNSVTSVDAELQLEVKIRVFLLLNMHTNDLSHTVFPRNF